MEDKILELEKAAVEALEEEKHYIISENMLRKYLTESIRYNALANGGVDNWEWYGESICEEIKQYSEDYEKDFEDIEDIVDYKLTLPFWTSRRY